MIALALTSARPMHAQNVASASRVAVPIPESVRRAIAAGTRDSSGRPGPNYWQLFVHYDLSAELDAESAELRGTGRISFINSSPHPLTEIRLRLDQNRFRPENATQLPPTSHTSGITIVSISANGTRVRIGGERTTGQAVLSNAQSTRATLHLAEPIASGDSARLDVTWRFTVPLDETGQALRLGRVGHDLFQVAQWYPRVAMLDDLRGWDTTPYTGDVEFYNPFARFDVRLRVPAGWLVGATGVLQNPGVVLSERMRARLALAMRSDSVVHVSTPEETIAETLARRASAVSVVTWHFVADSVNDFAWGTSSRYGWISSRARLANTEPVALHWLYSSPPGTSVEDVVERLRGDLVINSALVTPYRFPQHTLLGGPEGGMEYPMLTMSNGDGRLTHEIWHQWFPLTVGTDEARYVFLDEGVATFLTGVTDAARASTPFARGAAVPRAAMQVPLISPDRPEEPDPLAALYGYGRVTPMLTALADSVGHDRVMHALRDYATAWHLKHPTPWDFMFFMNTALKRDFSAFWYRWLFTTEP